MKSAPHPAMQKRGPERHSRQLAPRVVAVFALLLAGMTAPLSRAATLRTPSFTVTIEVNCAEGSVSCDQVAYRGLSHKTGRSLSLRGKTLHTRCKDGSPCRFLGYEFRAGTTLYRVWEDGRLEVRQGSTLLVDERGDWEW